MRKGENVYRQTLHLWLLLSDFLKGLATVDHQFQSCHVCPLFCIFLSHTKQLYILFQHIQISSLVFPFSPAWQLLLQIKDLKHSGNTGGELSTPPLSTMDECIFYLLGYAALHGNDQEGDTDVQMEHGMLAFLPTIIWCQ